MSYFRLRHDQQNLPDPSAEVARRQASALAPLIGFDVTSAQGMPSLLDLRVLALPQVVIALSSHRATQSLWLPPVPDATRTGVVITAPLRGALRCSIDGAKHDLSPADGALLWPLDLAAGFEHGPSARMTILFPCTRPGDGPAGSPPRPTRLRQQPPLQLLMAAARALVSHGRRLSAPTRHLAEGHLCALLALSIADAALGSNGAGTATARLARLLELKAHALTRLGDPALSLADVARARGVSAQHARALFNAGGASFSVWLRECRLERVAAALADPEHRAESISSIAYGCGFGDLSYFNRRFRARFGHAPGAFRARALTSPTPESKRQDQASPMAD